MPFPRAKKSFGQNFLADPTVPGKILAAAEIRPGERVLEIGPGTGVLTDALLGAGADVIAVEADADLLPDLRQRFPNLDLLAGDILETRRADATVGGRLEEGKYQLVANIPYNITSPILEEFLSRAPRPKRLVLMVQKEVADRLTAKPGEMSLLSVVCQLYADVKKVFNVPRGAFRPSPKVDSAVVRLDLRPGDPERVERIIRLAKAGFAAPRKQLHGNLSGAGYASERVKGALTALGIRPDARAQTLSSADWTQLLDRLNTG